MAGELYAWSTIKVGEPNNDPNNLAGGEVKVIKPGETVTQDGLGLNDEQFAQLVESGAVRTMEFPDMPPTYQDSPVNFFREQATKAAEGALVDAENSEENMSAILAANAAATGAALAPTLDPDVQSTMESQLSDTGSQDTTVNPSGGTGTTQVSPDS